MPANRVIEGDALAVLGDLPADSVHAIVTDPPYGLAFMGRSWDDFEPHEYQDWCEQWAREAKRVLKPGGHLLAFSGSRTHHRLFAGVEDAGFTIRDTLTWHYGSGFPKGQDIGKLIDKQAGKTDEREVVSETYVGPDGTEHTGGRMDGEGYESTDYGTYSGGYQETAPATDAAARWDGWNTQLKPATEFIVMARAPLAEDSITANVRAHGTGALNIDGCRIGGDVDTSRENSGKIGDGNKYSEAPCPDMTAGSKTGGRYPANLLLDDVAAARLDAQSGESESTQSATVNDRVTEHDIYESGSIGRMDATNTHSDSGGASRFFYCAKASKAERTLDGRIANAHPTVKPIAVMEWLVTLVTREGQTVLDPFCGSGTTLRAAKNRGRAFIGIEQQARWCDVARARCGLTPENPEVLTDAQQAALTSYGGTS